MSSMTLKPCVPFCCPLSGLSSDHLLPGPCPHENIGRFFFSFFKVSPKCLALSHLHVFACAVLSAGNVEPLSHLHRWFLGLLKILDESHLCLLFVSPLPHPWLTHTTSSQPFPNTWPMYTFPGHPVMFLLAFTWFWDYCVCRIII